MKIANNPSVISTAKVGLILFLVVSVLTVLSFSEQLNHNLQKNIVSIEFVDLMAGPDAGPEDSFRQTAAELGEMGLWRNQGLLLDKMGAYQEAQNSYGQQMAQQNDLLTSYFLGMNQFEQGDLYGAVDAWQTVDPAPIAQALCYQMESAIEQAAQERGAAIAGQLILLAPDNFHAQYCAGRGFTLVDQPTAAIAAFDTAIHIGTDNQADLRDVYYRKGNVHSQLSEWTAAASALSEAAVRAPDATFIAWRLGLALIRAGEYDEAERALLDAVARNPDSSILHFYLGMLEQERGDFEQAYAWYAKAYDLDATAVGALRELGSIALEYQNAPRSALTYFERALALTPEDRTIWIGLARTHEQLGDWDEMEAAYRQAVAHSRSSTQQIGALTDLADALLGSGLAERSLGVWQEIVAIAPDHERAQEMIVQIKATVE